MKSPVGYPFPFEEVPPNTKILLYGAGTVGKTYLEQIHNTGHCKVLGFIDQKKKSLMGSDRPIYRIDDIKNLEFDYIVIALNNPIQTVFVKRNLIDAGVDENNIITNLKQKRVSFESLKKTLANGSYAFQQEGVSVAIFLSGGFGDNIVTKKFFEALVALSTRFVIDLYSIRSKEYICSIYLGEPSVNEIFHDFAGEYGKRKYLYHVAIRLCDIPEMEWLSPIETWDKEDQEIYCRMEDFIMYRERLRNQFSYSHFLYYHKQIFLKQNYFSALSCGGIFKIDGHHVRIPVDEHYRKDYQKLDLKRYITINYGNGSTIGNPDKINKQWPYRYFVEFVSLFKEHYPDIEILQVGDASARKVNGVDRTFLGAKLELVKYILQNSIFHLDIEGGLVHLATQLRTKCIVLFGPTLEEFYGYPENINIRAGNCRGCWELYEGQRFCARFLPSPECMELITPKMVMDKVEEYLNSRKEDALERISNKAI